MKQTGPAPVPPEVDLPPQPGPPPPASPSGPPGPTGARVLVDCAGAREGGARRFLDELNAFLEGLGPAAAAAEVIGRERQLTLPWLVRREAAARHERTVALNNVGFVRNARPGRGRRRGERWVLLRKAAHFVTDDERSGGSRGPGMSRQTALQVPIVRFAAQRADIAVVPTSAMAERVISAVPSLRDRVVVRPHPVTPTPGAQSPDGRTPGQIICPILFSPYKDMGRLLRLADAAAAHAAEQCPVPPRILVTATEQERVEYGLTGTTRLEFIGRLTTRDLTTYRLSSQAVLYPTHFETFGYPLAEAHVERRPVIAFDHGLNREVAGDALVPYARETIEDMAAAFVTAMTTSLADPPSTRFDRDAYFRWLLDLPGGSE